MPACAREAGALAEQVLREDLLGDDDDEEEEEEEEAKAPAASRRRADHGAGRPASPPPPPPLFETKALPLALREQAGPREDGGRRGSPKRPGSAHRKRARSGAKTAERVLVAARIRPPLPGEEARHVNDRKAVLADPWQSTVAAWLPPSSKFSQTPEKAKRKVFEFDHVFDAASSQADVFENVGKPLVDSVLQGINGCLLAYGQTGAGKTFTTFGPFGNGAKQQREDPAKAGLLPRIAHNLFAELNSRVEVARTAAKSGRQQVRYSYALYVTYYQIYLDSYIQDLLNPSERQLQIRLIEPEEGAKAGTVAGHQVDGLSVHRVTSVAEIMNLLVRGDRCKVVSQTSMNAKSSRSHSIFTIQLVQHASGMEADALPQTTRAKLTCVDLAGSERVNRTHPQGLQLEEAKSINRSLAALGNVIAALASPSSDEFDPYNCTNVDNGAAEETAGTFRNSGEPAFVPWRDSKLTRVLQDSLSGRARVSLVINVGPGAENVKESINSLLFGRRSMCVSLEPEVNAKTDYKQLVDDLQATMDKMASTFQARMADMEAALREKDERIQAVTAQGSGGELAETAQAQLDAERQTTRELRETQELLEDALFEQLETNARLEASLKGKEQGSATDASAVPAGSDLRVRAKVLGEQLRDAAVRAASDQQRAESLQMQLDAVSQSKAEIEVELAQCRAILEETRGFELHELQQQVADLRIALAARSAAAMSGSGSPSPRKPKRSPRSRRPRHRAKAKASPERLPAEPDALGVCDPVRFGDKDDSTAADDTEGDAKTPTAADEQRKGDLEAKSQRLEAALRDRDERYTALEASMEDLHEELERAHGARESAESQLADLRGRVEELEERARAAESDAESLQALTTVQASSITALEEELEKVRDDSEAEHRALRVEALEAELAGARGAFAREQECIEIMRQRLDAAEDKLESMSILHAEERELYESMIRELQRAAEGNPQQRAETTYKSRGDNNLQIDLDLVQKSPREDSVQSLLSSPRLQSALQRSKLALARAMEAINDV